jgi:3-oxoacyl-[acyl-carrier protein] reductase
MQAEDIAELIIAQLKLNQSIYQNSSIWSTNPNKPWKKYLRQFQ